MVYQDDDHRNVNSAGFNIVEGFPRVLNEPMREKVLPSIRAMASSIGGDADMAVDDAIPSNT